MKKTKEEKQPVSACQLASDLRKASDDALALSGRIIALEREITELKRTPAPPIEIVEWLESEGNKGFWVDHIAKKYLDAAKIIRVALANKQSEEPAV